VLSYLLQLPVLLWVLSALALAALWVRRQDRRRRLGVLTAAFILLTLFCTPVTSFLLLRSLEARFPPLARRPDDVAVIVVLSGGVRAPDAEGLPSEPAEDTVYRCLRAAEMYHQGEPVPVLVSGGRVESDVPGPAYSSVMSDFLVRLGVRHADIIEENTSRNTCATPTRTPWSARASSASAAWARSCW
jgi:uncharacterized SAM-binding protein YcdF (DUF218 family)